MRPMGCSLLKNRCCACTHTHTHTQTNTHARATPPLFHKQRPKALTAWQWRFRVVILHLRAHSACYSDCVQKSKTYNKPTLNEDSVTQQAHQQQLAIAQGATVVASIHAKTGVIPSAPSFDQVLRNAWVHETGSQKPQQPPLQ
mmetsp:Transcript_50354/g.100144  ORF Transcript_50354/g.100144 Transcript_50354/m.100144 type:complete len:143 (+) Transcript_50354:323-751(+)